MVAPASMDVYPSASLDVAIRSFAPIVICRRVAVQIVVVYVHSTHGKNGTDVIRTSTVQIDGQTYAPPRA